MSKYTYPWKSLIVSAIVGMIMGVLSLIIVVDLLT